MESVTVNVRYNVGLLISRRIMAGPRSRPCNNVSPQRATHKLKKTFVFPSQSVVNSLIAYMMWFWGTGIRNAAVLSCLHVGLTLNKTPHPVIVCSMAIALPPDVIIILDQAHEGVAHVKYFSFGMIPLEMAPCEKRP